MLKLDHLVLHVDSNQQVQEIKQQMDAAGLPFEPSWGKKAKGFQISNIWIGRQYFEVVDILSRDNQWQPQWSKRHEEGERGVYCIFFHSPVSLDHLYSKVTEAQIAASKPERTRFKWLFGLLEKRLPWRFTVLPKIPGTDIEIGFIEYDEGAFKKFSPYMVPNCTDVGITGIKRCSILSSDTELAECWLRKLESIVGAQLPITLKEATCGSSVELTVIGESGHAFRGVEFSDVALNPAITGN